MIHSSIWSPMRQKEYSMSIFCGKWKWKCGCLVRKYQCQHYHSVKMGISYQQHRIAIGCFNGRSLPSRRGELNPSAPSGVWQGLFLCHLVFSLAFNVSSSECWAATGYSQKVLNLIKQFPSGLLTPVAPSGVWQATACHLVVNQACGGEAFIMCFSWGIVVAILLLRSCVESNPGPEVEQLQDQVEDWEFKNVPDLDKVFKTRRTICAVCKDGKVNTWPFSLSSFSSLQLLMTFNTWTFSLFIKNYVMVNVHVFSQVVVVFNFQWPSSHDFFRYS